MRELDSTETNRLGLKCPVWQKTRLLTDFFFGTFPFKVFFKGFTVCLGSVLPPKYICVILSWVKMETQCQKRYPTTFRPELHQSPVPLGFCYAKHGNRATRGQHCTLSVRNSALHPTSLEHRACHDANIAPWLLLANRLGLQASRQDLKSTDFYLSSDCA